MPAYTLLGTLSAALDYSLPGDGLVSDIGPAMFRQQAPNRSRVTSTDHGGHIKVSTMQYPIHGEDRNIEERRPTGLEAVSRYNPVAQCIMAENTTLQPDDGLRLTNGDA